MLCSRLADPKLHDASNCKICTIAKWTPIGKKNCSPNLKPKLLPKGEAVDTVPAISTKKICTICKQETGRGIPHPCNPNSAKRNLVDLIAKESTSGQEQVLSMSLKALVNEKGGEPGKELKLTGMMGGNPLCVTVGKSIEKPNPLILSSGLLGRLQKKLNCSERKLLMLARELKPGGVKFEANIREDLQKLSHCLDNFYTVEKLEFVESKGKNSKKSKVMIDLVYVTDLKEFVNFVIVERALNKEAVLVRIGIDGGQGSFKVFCSILKEIMTLKSP